MMHETMRKGSFCSGQTAFWSCVSINRTSHLSVGAQPLKRASHLACLFWAWWKCMKKMFLDNFAALSTVPNICQRACFYIKGAAVSLRELSDSRWRNQWAQMGSKSVISALSCPSEVASLKPGAKESIQNKDFTLSFSLFLLLLLLLFSESVNSFLFVCWRSVACVVLGTSWCSWRETGHVTKPRIIPAVPLWPSKPHWAPVWFQLEDERSWRFRLCEINAGLRWFILRGWIH